MIPWILIIAGALCAIIGVLGLFAILLLPIVDRFEIVFDKDKDVVQARTDSKIGKLVREEQKHLTRDFIICVFVGVMMFFAGIYLGYAEKGASFWPYRMLFPNEVSIQTQNQVWDKLNESGQFVASDGTTYTYYILVSGNDISLSGEVCADLADLKRKLEEIRRENTVVVYDSFAVSSTYRAVKRTLNELGIDYEETK